MSIDMSANRALLADIKDPLDGQTLYLRELNELITCKLCHGYLVDATTVIECLHTFCKSCIVKHLDEQQTSRLNDDDGVDRLQFSGSHKCPECDHVIHQSHPLDYIAFDRTLQDLVYKVVPGLEQSEIERERQFYRQRGLPCPRDEAAPSVAAAELARSQAAASDDHSSATSSSSADVTNLESLAKSLAALQTGEQRNDVRSIAKAVADHFHRFDEQVSMRLDPDLGSCDTLPKLERPFVRVSALATVNHVRKYIANMLYADSPDRFRQIEIKCNGETLFKDHTLKFVYVTKWRTKRPPLMLQYTLTE